MPNVRKITFDRIAEDLRYRVRMSQSLLDKNKGEIKFLAKQQRELKHEIAELSRLHDEFTKGKVKPCQD